MADRCKNLSIEIEPKHLFQKWQQCWWKLARRQPWVSCFFFKVHLFNPSCGCLFLAASSLLVDWLWQEAELAGFLSLHVCSRFQAMKRKCWWHSAIVWWWELLVSDWCLFRSRRGFNGRLLLPIVFDYDRGFSCSFFCASRACLALPATALPPATRFGFFAGWVVGCFEVTCWFGSTTGCVWVSVESDIMYIWWAKNI